MASKLILDRNEPGIEEVVAGASVGAPLSLSVVVVPTVMDDVRFEASIAEIEPQETIAEEADLAPEETEAEEMMEGMPASETGIDQGLI